MVGDDVLGLGSVVKVFCTTTKPNYRMPWQMDAPEIYTGSGCLIEGGFILTNAHVVNYGTTITLLKHGDPKRYIARVVAFGHEYDLAVLEVTDEDADQFWKNVTPLTLAAELPPLNSTVMILGYPTEVDSVSVTEGVVSRVMVSMYQHSMMELLKLQVDAAVNQGNSGGPAICDNKLVGIVSEVREGAQSIGYAVPVPVISHFLTQLARSGSERNDFPGICSPGFTWLACDNPGFREFHHLAKGEHGVVISNVLPCSDFAKTLIPGDVLMGVDNYTIADDGTILFRKSGEMVQLSYAFSSRFPGDTSLITFKRKGTMHKCIPVTLSGRYPRLNVQRQLNKPQYMVWGGLIFTQCSMSYIEEEFHAPPEKSATGIDLEKMPLNLQSAWFRQEKKHDDHEVVILSQVLADDITIGFAHYQNRVVEKLNGVPIQNMRQLADQLTNLNPKQHPFVRVDLDNYGTIVLKTEKAIAANPAILTRNNIHPPLSINKPL